jgi:hypothetical protein
VRVAAVGQALDRDVDEGAAQHGELVPHGAHRPVLQLVRAAAGSHLDRLPHSEEAKDFLRQGMTRCHRTGLSTLTSSMPRR